MAVRGALARLCVQCEVKEDRTDFYFRIQKLLLTCGLHVWVRQVHNDYIELAIAPPFIADQEFFDELELRLGRFITDLRSKNSIRIANEQVI